MSQNLNQIIFTINKINMYAFPCGWNFKQNFSWLALCCFCTFCWCENRLQTNNRANSKFDNFFVFFTLGKCLHIIFFQISCWNSSNLCSSRCHKFNSKWVNRYINFNRERCCFLNEWVCWFCTDYWCSANIPFFCHASIVGFVDFDSERFSKFDNFWNCNNSVTNHSICFSLIGKRQSDIFFRDILRCRVHNNFKVILCKFFSNFKRNVSGLNNLFVKLARQKQNARCDSHNRQYKSETCQNDLKISHSSPPLILRTRLFCIVCNKSCYYYNNIKSDKSNKWQTFATL